MITAKFGKKSFVVTGKKIYTPSGISISESIDINETEVKGKKPKTSVKAIKLQEVSFDVILDARFVDVEVELRWWKSTLLAKKPQWLYIGAYKVGTFYLTDYSVSDLVINNSGAYVKAKLSLSFTENGSYATSKTTNFVGSVGKSGSKGSKFRIGSTVKPKKNTRRYSTADDALKKKGKSTKNEVINHKINSIHSGKKAVLIHATKTNGKSISGWVRIEDVSIIEY